jgi:superfamily II RNA helicase
MGFPDPPSLPELKREEEARSSIVIPDEESVAQYYEYRQQLDQMSADFREVIHHPSYSLPFLQPGRLVKVKHKDLDFGWGVIINYQKRVPPKVRWCIVILVRFLNRQPHRINPYRGMTSRLTNNI